MLPKSGTVLTILDTTKFYLKYDPVNPNLIPTYRRNLLNLPDARWHLGYLLQLRSGSERVNPKHYNKVRENHYSIMRALEEGGYSKCDQAGIPLLIRAEVETIIDEGLKEFFKVDLDKVVRRPFPIHLHVLIVRSQSPRSWLL